MARIDLLKAQQEARQNQTPVQQGNEAHVANVRQQAQQMAVTPPPTQPVLQKVDTNKVYESTRNQALAATDESKAEQAMEFWNASPLEYWSQQAAKDPGNTYAYLQKMYASDETPEEKRKRERRDALGQAFQGLGNLIGNAANLYYTHRGGQYIDLNTANEKHLERMRRLKEKQDALAEKQRSILANAKLSDIKADRAEAAATSKAKREAAEKAKDRAWKIQYDAYMKELDNAHKLGQIDAQTKARLAEQAAKTKDAKELEVIKQQNRVALKKHDDSKVLTSLTGFDGGTWTRNTNLSKEEIRELSKYVEDWTPYTTVDESGKETIDYVGALADASESGLIPVAVLEERGFKRSKNSALREKETIDGFGDDNQQQENIPGF